MKLSDSNKTNTPVLDWSPLPQRKLLSFVENGFNSENKPVDEDSDPLYPDCDVSPWLRTCDKEITTPMKGRTTGHIPNWLNGSLIRNGPGSLDAGNQEFSHVFDGYALLHRFAIKNGEVSYQCRFLQSDVYKKNNEAKRIVVNTFATKVVKDPCHSIFNRVASVFSNNVADNSNVSIYPIGDELYAFGEVPAIHRINMDTLETKKKMKLDDYISIVHHTAHPHIMNDGTVYNLGTSVNVMGVCHNIIEFPKNDKDTSEVMFENARIVASLPARWPLNPSYMHTFGLTDSYYIIVEQPFSLSIPGMIITKITDQPVSSCFRWYHEEQTRISVISRKTGNIHKSFWADTFCYFHIINQYEDDNHIIIDICIYRDPSCMEAVYIDTLKSMQQNPDYAKMCLVRPARFVLPLDPNITADGTKNLVTLKNTEAAAHFTPEGNIFVIPERICDLGCDLPRINYEKHLGKPYRYFYSLSFDVDTPRGMATLVKVDVQNKTVTTWSEKHCCPGEPVFVPRPESKDEDDGIVLSAFVGGKEDPRRTGLLVFNAKSFTELGRVEFRTPSPVPYSLHGWFMPTNPKNA